MNRVWFSCSSTYHLLNAVYYSEKVDWGQNSEKTLIWINDTKNNIDISIFRDCFDEIIQIESLQNMSFFRRQYVKIVSGGRLFHCSVAGKRLKSKSTKNILICFSDMHYVTNKLINEFAAFGDSEICLVEEGIGIYSLNERRPKTVKSRFANALLGIKEEYYLGAHHAVQTIIVQHPDSLPKPKSDGRLVVRQNNIFNDREWCKCFLKRFPDIDRGNNKKHIALWIGDPLGGDFITMEKEREALNSIFSILSQKYQIIIKKHPRETYENYDKLKSRFHLEYFDYDYSWLPVELLVQAISPEIIISPFSSALNNIAGLQGNWKIVYTYKLFSLDLTISIPRDNQNVYVAENGEQLRKVFERDEFFFTPAPNKNEEIEYFQKIAHH